MKIGQNAGLGSALALWAGPVLACGLAAAGTAHGQSETHGRKYQPPPATGHIVVVVEKSYNEKPLENAAVIFHATRNGKDNGNLEIKTNSQGKATMDLLEVGSHVTVQVIAGGYATAAQDFDVTDADQNILIKMARPRAQVSTYVDNDGKASTLQPGLQEQEHKVTNKGPKVTTAVVSGTLKDEHGGRILGGIVRLHLTAGTAPDVTQATDSVGNFRFERIAPGTYSLQLSAPGYTDTRREVVLGAGDVEVYQETLHTAPPAGAPVRSPLPQAAGGPQ